MKKDAPCILSSKMKKTLLAVRRRDAESLLGQHAARSLASAIDIFTLPRRERAPAIRPTDPQAGSRSRNEDARRARDEPPAVWDSESSAHSIIGSAVVSTGSRSLTLLERDRLTVDPAETRERTCLRREKYLIGDHPVKMFRTRCSDSPLERARGERDY